ncbi:MAG: thiamine phosphate synthase, partial [Rickettsiales bacterium]|nr:thiamine phosphate synthase [Rickettsiales bacterium]
MTEKAHCQLYLISPPQLELGSFVPKLKEVLETGLVPVFQLRLKDANDAMVQEAAKALLPLCHAHECAFIMNDRPDLAKALGADGVHLGQEDLNQWPVAKAREVLGDTAVIGVSCHASRHLAMEAGEQGADYVAFGAFYPTQSKPKEKLEKWGTPTPDILAWWSQWTTIPCVAIGGITPDNAKPLVEAGADFLAVITAIWGESASP